MKKIFRGLLLGLQCLITWPIALPILLGVYIWAFIRLRGDRVSMWEAIRAGWEVGLIDLKWRINWVKTGVWTWEGL